MAVGQMIGNYRVTGLLGEGGFAAVYLAEHPSIGRRVAIKVLHPTYAGNQDMVARLTQEARAVNLIRHPGVVDIYNHGQMPDGAPWIAMDYLEGEPLDRRLARPLPLEEVLRICRDVAQALAAAHAQGVIHRDLKPANIMLAIDPSAPGGTRPKVLDFGIAKLLSTPERGAAPQTRTGTLLGTPGYMAPEQWTGPAPVSDRTDVYALGVMLYLMLAGELPFTEPDLQRLAFQHLAAPPPPLSARRSLLPPPLLSLVDAMLRKEPAQRPAMAEVAQALDGILSAWMGTAAPTPGSVDRDAATADRGARPSAGPGGAPLAGHPARVLLGIGLGALLALGAVGIGLGLRPGHPPARDRSAPAADLASPAHAVAPAADLAPSAPPAPVDLGGAAAAAGVPRDAPRPGHRPARRPARPSYHSVPMLK